MHRITREAQERAGYRYAFDPDDDPLLTVDPGERLVVESEDSYHGQLFAEGRRDRSTEPRSNPLSGPVAVEGASPGDTLAVHVESIEPLEGRASTYVPSWWWYLGPMASRRAMDHFVGVDPPEEARELAIELDGDNTEGTIDVDGRTVPYEPMLGTIGTAPARTPAPNGPAGPHGGNMDLPIVRPGSTVYLPVNASDALLALGDAHAAQGEAEVTGVAAEMPARTTLQVDLLRNHGLSWPRVETDTHLYAVTAKTPFSTFEDAIRLAFVLLVGWLETRGFDQYDALRLGAVAGRLLVGNFNCVAAGLPKALLD
jgi:acetamidase/formamidase